MGPALDARRDPKLLLARAHHLVGDNERANDIVRDYLAKALDDAEGDSEQYIRDGGFYRISLALQAVDDDANAVLAWLQYTPTNINGDVISGSGVNADTTDSGDEATTGAEREESESEAVNNLEDLPNDMAIKKQEIESESSGSTSTLEGTGFFLCDGCCGVQWSFADNFWQCKDDVSVQFDSVCYEKLKAGKLDIPVCSKDHDHIYIPPFDEKVWRTTPKDQVLVGGSLMSRQTWLESIRKAWQIDEESMTAKQRSANAAHKIQRTWRIYKAVQMQR